MGDSIVDCRRISTHRQSSNYMHEVFPSNARHEKQSRQTHKIFDIISIELWASFARNSPQHTLVNVCTINSPAIGSVRLNCWGFDMFGFNSAPRPLIIWSKKCPIKRKIWRGALLYDSFGHFSPSPHPHRFGAVVFVCKSEYGGGDVFAPKSNYSVKVTSEDGGAMFEGIQLWFHQY